MKTLTVGDKNRSKTFEITAISKNYNGTLSVTVACPYARTKQSDATARRLARRCVENPWSARLTHVSPLVDDAYRILVTFSVSSHQ